MDYPPPPSYQEAVDTQPYGEPYGAYNNGFQQPDIKVLQPVTHQPVTNQESGPQPSRVLTDLEKLYRVINDRLVYDFEKVTCCPNQFSGLDVGVEDQVPSELAEKGIAHDVWREWITELREVQKLHPTICGCLLMFCFPGFLVQSMLCACFCPISGSHPLQGLPCCYGDWYEGLKKWQRKVNDVLNRHEMHAKLTTYKPHNRAPKSKNHGTRVAGKDHNYEMSFLEIAVTKQASMKLQNESWDHGVNDGCTSGNGRCL